MCLGQKVCSNIVIEVIHMAIINNRAYQAYNHLIDGFARGNMSRGFEDESNK